MKIVFILIFTTSLFAQSEFSANKKDYTSEFPSDGSMKIKDTSKPKESIKSDTSLAIKAEVKVDYSIDGLIDTFGEKVVFFDSKSDAKEYISKSPDYIAVSKDINTKLDKFVYDVIDKYDLIVIIQNSHYSNTNKTYNLFYFKNS